MTSVLSSSQAKHIKGAGKTADEYDPQKDGAGSYLVAIEAKRARGDTYYLRDKIMSECIVEGCKWPRYAKGLCSAHYDRWRRYGDPLRGGELSWKPKHCNVEGCEKPVIANGLCNAHYKRQRRHSDPLGGGTSFGDPMKFLVETACSYTGDECLTWPFVRGAKGYGRVSQNGRMRGAHRVVCEIVHGKAPSAELEVAHSCGKGPLGCVNPRHLSWKTRAENHADKLIHGTHNRGEHHQIVKLSENDVRQIRALRGILSGREIARRFGVSAPTICNIHKRITWGWLK